MIKNVNISIFFYSIFFLFLVLEGVVQYFLQSVNGEKFPFTTREYFILLYY